MVSPTMACLPVLTPSMFKVQYQVDNLKTHDKCVSTDPAVPDFDMGALPIPNFVLPDAMVTDSDTGAYPGPKFMVQESAAQPKYVSLSRVGVENDQCVLPVPNFFDPIKLSRNQATSCNQPSILSHIPKANTPSINQTKAASMASRVATSFSKKRGHELLDM